MGRSKSGIILRAVLVVMGVCFMASAYTITGYNNATWAGGGITDSIVVNGSGYLPMAASDCPKDTIAKYAQVYKDKIFNGCLDECSPDNSGWTHGLATVLDWSKKSWVVAQIYSNLHHTGIWPQTGTYALQLVLWIKGTAGGEDTKFTLAVHYGGDKTSNAVRVPVPVISTGWKQEIIPWSTFKPPTGAGTPDGIVFAAGLAGRTTFFVDQVYVTSKIPPAVGVVESVPVRRQINAARSTSIELGNPGNVRFDSNISGRIFDFTGKQIKSTQSGTNGYKAFIVERKISQR
jgi:hypothetical protein